MAGAVFALEHFAVHSDRHGVVGGLGLIAAESVVGVALYTGLLSALAPAFRGQLGAGLRRLSGRSGGARRTSAIRAERIAPR
jgi:hypothetical protein